MNSGIIPKASKIFRLDMANRFLRQRLLDFECRTAETHRFLADSLLYDFVETDKSATADEENLLGIDLDVFLMRMLAAALWRNVAGAALENFQQRLLHAFTGDVARDADVVGLASDLIDLVDVNDADLGALHVVIRVLQQPQNNVLDVFADVAGFSQRRRIRDTKWNIENLRERFSQQRFSRTGRSDQQNVALLDFDFRQRVRLKHRRCVCGRRRAGLQDALEMVVNCDRQRFLGDILTDYVLVERSADIDGLRDANGRRLPTRILVQLFIEDAFANVYAAVANVDTGTGDEFSNLGVAFATEGAHRQVRGACHKFRP